MSVFTKRIEKPIASKSQGMPVVLLLSAWFGLLVGFTEALTLVFKTYFLHRITGSNQQVIWMAPLSSGLLFTGIGVFLLIAGRLWSQIASQRFNTTVFAFLAFLSLFCLVPGLHSVAKLLLALGLAIQFARVVTTRGFNLYRMARQTTMRRFGIIIAHSAGPLAKPTRVFWVT